MGKEKLRNIAVRITIKDENGKVINYGSGVIIKDEKKFYVITALHCIQIKEGDKQIIPSLENIHIECQQHYHNTEFERIKILNISENNQTQDWALLNVEQPSNDLPNVLIGSIPLMDTEVCFRGFQKQANGNSRIFDSKIKEPSPEEFTITLYGDTFQYGSEDGAMIAKGLSGSGVFLLQDNEIYLIGILKQVIGEEALNNDIICCPVSNLNGALKSKYIDLLDIKSLKNWENKIEETVAKEEVDQWIQDNIDDYNNILRKSKIIQNDDQKARDYARKKVLKYLNHQYLAPENWSLFERFENGAKTFEESVEENYTRIVDNNKEAKDLLIKLEQDFSSYLKNNVLTESEKTDFLKLARYKIAWWLMNCSLDFN